jgi:predicted RNase H-like HicB family nuclease
MLPSYIRAAMRRAPYELVEDDGSFYGEIPSIPGLWANATTLEGCREELESVLEGWVLLSIADHSPTFSKNPEPSTLQPRRQTQ